ncbi:hypothetical protein [Bradyrhizobium sp.]|uniref:hypothetical protein n=1 Tax=Bradyrhizobium sp. TaxID=376 RepID=UPI003C13146E
MFARSGVPRNYTGVLWVFWGTGWSPLQRGDWVCVTPDDYGNPVHGAILAWTADEIVIRHQDPSVGKVNVHFPRVGFDVAPAQRLAA